MCAFCVSLIFKLGLCVSACWCLCLISSVYVYYQHCRQLLIYRFDPQRVLVSVVSFINVLLTGRYQRRCIMKCRNYFSVLFCVPLVAFAWIAVI